MRHLIAVILMGSLFGVSGEKCSADLITATGTWSANVTGQGYNNESFTGSATFQYDTNDVSGAAVEWLHGPLTSFSQSPSPIGATVFDLSNTGYSLRFLDGTRDLVVVGGDSPTTIIQNEDDFGAIGHIGHITGGDTRFSITVASENSIVTDTSASVAFTFESASVPEPTSLAIFGTIGLIACSRRRKS